MSCEMCRASRSMESIEVTLKRSRCFTGGAPQESDGVLAVYEMGCRSESNDGALGRESAPVSADQSGEDRREHGGPEDRIMVHVIRNERTVAHANERIHQGEADRARGEVRRDTVPAQKGETVVGLRPRGFSHDRGRDYAAGR